MWTFDRYQRWIEQNREWVSPPPLTAAQAEQLPVKAAAAPPARKPPRAPPCRE